MASKAQINFSSKEAKQQLNEILEHFQSNPSSFLSRQMLEETKRESTDKITQKEVLEYVVSNFYDRMKQAEKALEAQTNNKTNLGKIADKNARIEGLRKEVKLLCKVQQTTEERFLFFINESFVKSQICGGQMRDAKAIFEDPELCKFVEQSNIKAGLAEEVERDNDPTKRASYNLKFRQYPNKNKAGVYDFIEEGLNKLRK